MVALEQLVLKMTVSVLCAGLGLGASSTGRRDSFDRNTSAFSPSLEYSRAKWPQSYGALGKNRLVVCVFRCTVCRASNGMFSLHGYIIRRKTTKTKIQVTLSLVILSCREWYRLFCSLFVSSLAIKHTFLRIRRIPFYMLIHGQLGIAIDAWLSMLYIFVYNIIVLHLYTCFSIHNSSYIYRNITPTFFFFKLNLTYV